MDINTTISIDMDDLANELEDQIREIAEDQINQNDNSFQDDDDVAVMIADAIHDSAILDADDVQQLIDEKMPDAMAEYAESIVLMTTHNVSEMITAALDDHDTDLNGELIDLRNECQDMRNEVEKLRRSMRILLEEREAGIKQRMIRAYNGGSQAISNAIRKVQNAWPTKKD